MIAEPAAPQRPRDDRLKAVLLICSAVACASTQDAIVKHLSGGYPLHQVLAIRSLVAIPILGALVLWSGCSLATPRLGLVLLRAAILCSAYHAFALSTAAIPIADTVAIYFTMPFFAAAFSGVLLGETVGLHRWLAIAAGFAGVLVMIRPGAGVLEPAALLALYAAAGYGLGEMMGRPIGQSVEPAVSAFHQNLVYLGVSLTLAAIYGSGADAGTGHRSLLFLTRPWVWPPGADLVILLATGVLGGLALTAFTAAYKHAEVSFVAPFEYTSMAWAVLWGYVLFADLPGPHTLLGGGIVILAGLVMIALDNRRRRRAEVRR